MVQAVLAKIEVDDGAVANDENNTTTSLTRHVSRSEWLDC
jgi:hypothetical protein